MRVEIRLPNVDPEKLEALIAAFRKSDWLDRIEWTVFQAKRAMLKSDGRDPWTPLAESCIRRRGGMPEEG